MTVRPKAMRIPDDLWAAALIESKRRGETLTGAVVSFLELYVRDADRFVCGEDGARVILDLRDAPDFKAAVQAAQGRYHDAAKRAGVRVSTKSQPDAQALVVTLHR